MRGVRDVVAAAAGCGDANVGAVGCTQSGGGRGDQTGDS